MDSVGIDWEKLTQHANNRLLSHLGVSRFPVVGALLNTWNTSLKSDLLGSIKARYLPNFWFVRDRILAPIRP